MSWIPLWETFAKYSENCNAVIPAKAGIQCFQVLSGFRIALRLSGMTEKRVLQRTLRKLSDLKLGLLLNFNVPVMKDGIVRVVNKLSE